MKAPALSHIRRLALVLMVLSTGAQSRVFSAHAAAPRLVSQTVTVNNRASGPLTINGCNSLFITLRNTGDAPAQSISALLTSITPGVRVTQARSAFPNLAPNQSGTSDSQFQISTAANLACGTPVNLRLRVSVAGGAHFTFRIRLNAGTVFTQSFESSDVPKNIPDGVRLRPGVASSSLQVSGFSGAAAKVTASLYLTHTYDSDLQITLISPDNTRVNLSDRSGGDGEDFGRSSANRTHFDDAASPLSEGSAPFVGTFEPDQPLAAFIGKSGAALNGRWRLEITDNAGGDVGTLRNWGLTIERVNCTDGGGGCGASETPSLVVTTIADTIDATDGHTSLREAILFANQKPSAAGTQRITFALRGTGAHVIKVGSVSGTALPVISHSVILDGRSQPGFAGTPLIVLDGTLTPRNVDGLLLLRNGSTITGLAINSFDRAAINVQSDGNTIAGNILGSDAQSTPEIGSNFGVLINGVSNRVGGSAQADCNVIGGNNFGVALGAAGTHDNLVIGNRIGLSLNGRARIPNRESGVLLSDDAMHNRIGGIAASEANRIAFNGEHGVVVSGAGTIGNAIRGNSIFANGALGINLDSGAEETPFVSPNDAGDADIGPNNLQNFPVIASAASGGGSTSIIGQLDSRPSATYVLDFYANTLRDASGFGEGSVYLGSASVTTGADGLPNTPDKKFHARLSASVTAGRFISATATDSNGSTSEFSRGVASAVGAVVQFSAATYSASENGVATITLSRGGDLSAVSVRVETQDGSATGDDYSALARNIAFAQGQTSASFTVSLVNDAIVESDETVELTLFSLSANSIVGARSAATLTIVNDDFAPRITVSRGALQRIAGSYSGGLFGGASGFRQVVTMRNEGQGDAPGPFSLALDNLRGSAVHLENVDGVTRASAPAGSPFVNFSAGADDVLSAGEAVEVTLEFTARDSGLDYTPRVIAGNSPR